MSLSQPNVTDSGENTLKSFQLDTLSIKAKSDKAFGLSISKFISSTINGGYSGYYFARNNRIRINRNYANGRIDVQGKFADRLDFNGKENYANLAWQAIQIVNRIISGLVGRWMMKNEKIAVKATDSLSEKEKMDQFEDLEFIIENREKLAQLQEASGVQMIPDDGIPADKEELNLWQSQFQRIPEEILYELGCNDILAANGWFDVMKEKALHDSAEAGFVGTETYMDEQGVIHVDDVKPENAIYSYSDYPDFRDTSWRGQIKARKISEIRRKYGVEFGGKLTEEELWNIAGQSKDYKDTDNLRWDAQWNGAFMRPYDEWNILTLEFELKTVDCEPYTVVTTKKNKSTILKKGKPEKLGDNEEYVEDTMWNIYRGVFIQATDTLLEWGLKKNMIRPQDPKELGNAEFSYSFYMYQNYQMRNLAVPEKIQEPVDQMILVCLKIQQCVAKSKPIGAAINWDALQNIDYGLGDKNKTIDVKKLYDQTGDVYYRGTDADGKQIPIPIQELQNSGFLAQMQGLVQLYQFWYGVLKDELGEDPALMSQALQPRVTAGNVDTAQEVAANATDYMYNAYKYVMNDTARKISCLLHKSVTYGSDVYRKNLNQEDIKDRIFGTNIQMMPTEMELQKLEMFLNNAITGNPELIIYLDPFQIMRIAKEDVKLAEQFIRNAQKKMFISQRQQAAQNAADNAKAQQESLQMGGQIQMEVKSHEGDIDMQQVKMSGDAQNKSTVLTGIMAMYQKQQETGAPIPPELVPLVRAVLQNVAIPATISNEQMQQEVAQQMQAAQQEQDQAAQEQENMPSAGKDQPINQQQPQLAA